MKIKQKMSTLHNWLISRVNSESYACQIPSQKCSRLWCQRSLTVNGKVNKICVTKHMPWADRTPCGTPGSSGPEKWCQSGKCVVKSTESVSPEPIHGNWSTWQAWGVCSFSCGRGVRRRKRLCDNPKPFNGGDYCSGAETNYDTCNEQSCPSHTDRRQEQCDLVRYGLRYGSSYGSKKTEFVADWSSGCTLSCTVPLRPWLSRSNNGPVKDGTKCSKDRDDVCIGGKCVTVGCDGELYGTTTNDICGVCGGDGTSCRAVSRRHYTGIQNGWKDMEMIPSNSTNVQIVQTDSYPYDGVSLCLYDPIRKELLLLKRIQVLTLIVYLSGNKTQTDRAPL